MWGSGGKLEGDVGFERGAEVLWKFWGEFQWGHRDPGESPRGDVGGSGGI